MTHKRVALCERFQSFSTPLKSDILHQAFHPSNAEFSDILGRQLSHNQLNICMVWHIWGWGKESVPSHSSVVWKFLQQWPSPEPGQKIFPGPTLKALSLSAVSFDKKRQNSKIRTRLLVRFPEPLWVGEPDYSTPLPDRKIPQDLRPASVKSFSFLTVYCRTELNGL